MAASHGLSRKEQATTLVWVPPMRNSTMASGQPHTSRMRSLARAVYPSSP